MNEQNPIVQAWEDAGRPHPFATFRDGYAAAQPAAAAIRDETLEAAAAAAEHVGRPVGAGDGDTYIPGSSADAAKAIRALKSQTPARAQDREDTELLNFLDSTNAQFKMGWRCGVALAGNVSLGSVIQLSGQPTSIRDAIRAGRAAKKKS